MDFVRKAREAAGQVAAKASDPETQERARRGLQAAGRQAGHVAGQAKEAAGHVAAKAGDPETQERARLGLKAAGRHAGDAARAAKRSVTTIVERIDPSLLADLIIKATALQERTNSDLRKKGSTYRISEIQISAAIPPGVNFSIGRIDDIHAAAEPLEGSSSDLLDAAAAAGEEEPILALDGEVPVADLEPDEEDAGGPRLDAGAALDLAAEDLDPTR